MGAARFKVEEEDFLVEEDLGFCPSGEGEHCFLWVEKRGLGSNDAARAISEKLGVRKRLVSHCGLKDLRAVTRQWFSVHLPGQVSPAVEDVESEGVRVLRVTRNLRKLRRGAHDGNRFCIRLRECGFARELLELRWAEILRGGVPNYFGEQRFGRRGQNVERALALLRGEVEVRDRLIRGLYLSAARSWIFNTVVGARVEDGSWGRVLDGEVFGFSNNRSLVLPEKVRGDEKERFAVGELELTAPLWGEGELLSVGEVRALEERAVAGMGELTAGLAAMGLRQERRVMRLIPRDGGIEWEGSDCVLRFALPKGAYATAVLREVAGLDGAVD